jgi:hypothetical protein
MNIYSDKAFLPEDVPHAPLLYPFWGFQSPYGDSTLGRRSYEHYLEKGTELFELTSLSEARFAVLPFHWEHVVDYVMRRTAKGLSADTATPELALKRAEEFAALAAGEVKPAVVFFSHDSVEEVPLDNSVVFRTSLSGSSRHRNEYAMPFWMPDEVEALFGRELPLREKATRPVIGFCGYDPVRPDAHANFKRALNRIPGASRLTYRLGVQLTNNHPFSTRAAALEAVSRSHEVQTNFILRDKWFNGAFEDGRLNRALMDESRREYVENIFGSDYVLCTRGSGNYSIRFYETLSSGRIPVFVNTDCVLPFEEWVDWKQYCVWVEARDVSHIPDKVAEFHENLSPDEFKDRQRASRSLWEEWLSPYGFFKNLRRYFE